MTSTSCLLCGVGGQGTVLASKLLAYALSLIHISEPTRH